MKAKRILLAVLVALTGVTANADSSGNDSSISQNPQVPVIIVKKGKESPGKHVPGIQMEACATLTGGQMYLSLPFDNYPVETEVELLTYPGGFWTATLYDAQSPIDGFEGLIGEYTLTLTTDDGTSYSGYLVIE